MKRLILTIMLLGSVTLMAQNYFPRVVHTPTTGFPQLLQENPYVISFTADGADWTPSMRYIREKSPNTNFLGVNITSDWDNGIWTDVDMTTDSFILDDQNQISTVFTKNVLNYPGYLRKSKSKAILIYNTQNQLDHYEFYNAPNINSNSYQKMTAMYFKYNSEGKRILDSSVYYNGGNIQVTLTGYEYMGGKPYSMTTYNTSDTTRITRYTYDGDLLTAITSREFDVNADEWTTTSADSFEYNPEGQISRRWTLGYVSINGVISLQPVRNDSYTYTPGGHLEQEIMRFWTNGVWHETAKREFTYDANNKPEIGYEYEYVVNDWATAPRTQYFFGLQTGTGSQMVSQSEVSVFPNPADKIVTIKLDAENAGLKLFDITGKCVYEQTNISGEHRIDISSFENGIYYAIIQGENVHRTEKLIVRH